MNAYQECFPGVPHLQCYPHIARKAVGEKVGLLVQKDRKGLVGHVVLMLHLCRTKEMFDALGKVAVCYLTGLGEGEYASWLQDEYLAAPFATWYVTASGVPGITPSANPQESYHRWLKTNKVLGGTRQSTDELLHTTFKQVLLLDAKDVSNKPINPRSDVLPAEQVEAAHAMLVANKAKSVPVGDNIVAVYCNTSHRGNKAITPAVITAYEQGLKGALAGGPKTKYTATEWAAVLDHNFSLHKATIDPSR